LRTLSGVCYCCAAGVCALFWGPASDRYGRRTILLLSTIMLLAFTVGCYFAHTIGLLILFRGLQGAAGEGYMNG
jgi:DHA1 family bicyclomycin/chloramphenicol resistance-like MFS transporter